MIINWEKQKLTVQSSSWEKVSIERKPQKGGDIGAVPTFRFYCDNDGRDGGRNECALRKSQ